MSEKKKVGELQDFPPQKAVPVEEGEERIVICNVEGRLYGVEDRCTHDGEPIGDGPLEGYEIECPRHGARFDIRDGSVTLAPAFLPLKTYSITVLDGEVLVDFDSSSRENNNQ